MKKFFTNIQNDTTYKSQPNQNIQLNSVVKTEPNETKQFKQSPANLVHFVQNFHTCIKCFQGQNNSQSLMFPCKCTIPIHKKCLQENLSSEFGISLKFSGRLKCKQCKQFYLVQIRNKSYLNLEKMCNLEGSIVKHYLLLILILVGIVFLSIFYRNLCSQDVFQTDNNQINSSNAHYKEASNKYLKEQQNSLISRNEMKMLIVLLILLLSLIFFIIIVGFVKKHLIQKKIVILDHQRIHSTLGSDCQDENSNDFRKRALEISQ